MDYKKNWLANTPWSLIIGELDITETEEGGPEKSKLLIAPRSIQSWGKTTNNSNPHVN
jgi:hypothetical protein